MSQKNERDFSAQTFQNAIEETKPLIFTLPADDFALIGNTTGQDRIKYGKPLYKYKKMRSRIMITILLCLSFVLTHAQNERSDREAFTLRLPLDGEQYYEEKIESSPFLVKDNLLQIYPGERVFIEVERDKEEIISMRVVKKNLYPDNTIEVEFTQTIKDRTHDMMTLKVVNPFQKHLDYKAMMFPAGQDKGIMTSILPIPPKLTGYEIWPDVITTLVLFDWKFN